MRFRLFSMLFGAGIFAVLVISCRKAPVEISTYNRIKDSVEAIDLKSIDFKVSPNPLYFNSMVFGREALGIYPTLNLSGSGWTHPSILHIENRWNGYAYWAALTPYPETDSQFENPHIFCSNDGIKWIEPKGIKNPIEPCPKEYGFNSDVNLLMDNNVLICYWRASEKHQRAIYMRKSEDGITWGEKKLVCQMPYTIVDVISPSFIKNEGKYYCYAVSGKEEYSGNYYNKYSIRRMISANGGSFIPEKNNGYDLIKISGRPWGDKQEPWHIEVQKVKNIWLLLVSTTNLDGFGGGGRLFLGYSTDGINFNFESKPVCITSASSYKSSFHPKLDLINNRIDIELWRASMGYGWAIFYDTFSIKINGIK